MKQHEEIPPLCVVKGAGAWLTNDQGLEFMDCISSWWTNLFGHANPRINSAIKAQLDQIEHVMLAGLTHPPVIELSEKLASLTAHHLGHAFYASDGASAVEIALKMSHHFWRISGQTQKSRFVCLKGSYHGETLGALSVTDVALFRQAYGELLSEPLIVMSPDARQATPSESADQVALRAAQELEHLFEAQGDQIAALIIEPLVQCAGQMAMHSSLYLKRARELCDQYQVHLICDEIAVGCGRTGTFFASEQAGIWPDFLTLSKGISGGYLPLSLSLTTNTIYQAFYSDSLAQGFLHSHSYTGNPLACTAANACLSIFEHDQVLLNNQIRAQQMHDAFAWVQEDERLQHFRQTGMILAFDVKPNVAQEHPSFSKQMFQHALSERLLIRPIGHTVYVMPPFILDVEQIEFMSRGIKQALDSTVSSMTKHSSP
jgi:adenosylmethionine-8-amino-7-oxononanoate aminotransferase